MLNRLLVAAIYVAMMGTLTGCSPRPAAILTVQPASVAPDQPIRISVTGLAAGASVTLHVSTTPVSGAAWSSTATFKANAKGAVSTVSAPASGDYAGAHVDGLEEALHAPRGDSTGFQAPTSSPWRLHVTAASGENVLARATAIRHPCLADVTVRRLTLSQDHVLGVLYEPKRPRGVREPGVVTIGGSSGGFGVFGSACDLAADGIPALSVAYFHEPGLQDQLERIPIEYFAIAAQLLSKAPGVDPDHVLLWGESRGSEAAALTAAHYPALVHGAILTVPASAAEPAPQSPTQAAWTYQGKAVPTEGIGHATSTPAVADLPVENIDGPVLAVCAGKDAVWPSCPQAAQLGTRLRNRGGATRFTLLTYPAAGHFVGSLTPYYPTSALSTVADGDTTVSGGTSLADAEARDDAWPQLIRWLHQQQG